MSADLGGAEGDVRKKQSGCGRVTRSVRLQKLPNPDPEAKHVSLYSAAEAALMFNSSLFVLVHGNPGFPPGISPREADLVFAALSRCIKAPQQHAGGCRRVIYLTSLV
ncbi:hypothetical protein D9C73_009045 [Collichthys lucidus]|uniref:Uncharacterized protein n=1 Tax=Collichthys lucidus TaxID=240159 RepID=A0A4V6AP11_COLLU|nr:hypothetical protein D9C73_009045 [Collichthys lucidus]